MSDTAALVARPPGGGEDHSVSVRKIDNGYLVRTSTCDERTGMYRSSEQFYERAPKILPPRVARGAAPDAGNALADARKYLGEDV